MRSTSYVPHIDSERAAMCAAIGVESPDELYRAVPEEVREATFDLPAGQTEIEIEEALRDLAARNRTDLVSFLGGGFYEHYIPAAVDAILARGEFYTAYTPYQPEVSQGTLQTAFEFQSGICRLTGMEVANASLYDGGSALYEALMMAARVTKRRTFLIDEGVSPIYRRMLATYCAKMDVTLVTVPSRKGVPDREALKAAMDEELAAVVLQYPNFFGCIDDCSEVISAAQAVGGLGIVGTYPVALGLLRPPGEMGADIVVGEGQSLGVPLSFGGPYLGFLATHTKLVRKMPGRVVGMTQDAQERRGFVLTLQAREQHIRREKATSNICTNQNLCAVAAAVYMALLGKQGLQDVAELCADNASYAYSRLTAIPGVKRTFTPIFFNEFCLTLPRNARDVVGDMIDRGFAMGFPVGRYYPKLENVVLIAVTEMRTKEQIDQLAAALEGVLRH